MSEIFGNKLKEIRIEKKLSQQTLGTIFNVSKMTISAWENNKQEPSIADITKLAKFFDISTDYLLGLEDESGRKINNNNFNNNQIGNININN